MSSVGRGRGYTGRQHRPDQRPGDMEAHDEGSKRLSPRSPEQKSESKPMPDKCDPKLTSHDDIAMKELLYIDEQYRTLLVLLEQFSPGEDGIQFNRKLRHFESTVANLCPDEAKLSQAFATFRAAALQNSNTARKLAAVGASFTRQQKQLLLRGALLNVVMQGTFCKLDLLEKGNPKYLINAANLLGDYFAEARLCNGNKVHILASPLLKYLKALLVCNDLRAHRSLATQLMQNGRELLSVLPGELDELSISVRIRLLTPPPFTQIWLLLSADLCLNKFLPLPNTLQQFYASHIDLSSEECGYSEVSYGSWKSSPDRSDVADAVAAVHALNVSDEDNMRPKLRPILGAGAALLKQEQGQEFETWTAKPLSKRYDLNSWRQDNEDADSAEPLYNPAVLPPNIQFGQVPAQVGQVSGQAAQVSGQAGQVSAQVGQVSGQAGQVSGQAGQVTTVTVPNYPPPNINRFSYDPHYLQQGDGAYIQNQYSERPQQHFQQGDGAYVAPYEPVAAEKVNNELQKKETSRPVDNWRQDSTEPDTNRNRPKNWSRQSRESVSCEDVTEGDRDERERRHVADRKDKDKERRRHVSDVPRSHKYWDHDDRCDIDYNNS